MCDQLLAVFNIGVCPTLLGLRDIDEIGAVPATPEPEGPGGVGSAEGVLPGEEAGTCPGPRQPRCCVHAVRACVPPHLEHSWSRPYLHGVSQFPALKFRQTGLSACPPLDAPLPLPPLAELLPPPLG